MLYLRASYAVGKQQSVLVVYFDWEWSVGSYHGLWIRYECSRTRLIVETADISSSLILAARLLHFWLLPVVETTLTVNCAVEHYLIANKQSPSSSYASSN